MLCLLPPLLLFTVMTACFLLHSQPPAGRRSAPHPCVVEVDYRDVQRNECTRPGGASSILRTTGDICVQALLLEEGLVSPYTLLLRA
jgi:hypothetical protein